MVISTKFPSPCSLGKVTEVCGGILRITGKTVYLKHTHNGRTKSKSSIDRIEYDVDVQISDLQDGVCACVHAFVRSCAI